MWERATPGPLTLEGRDPSASRPGSGSSQAAVVWFPGPPACVGGHTQRVFLLAVAGVCGCCGALRPRYKRLVDNIFPEDPEVGHTSARHHLPRLTRPGLRGEGGSPALLTRGLLRLWSAPRGLRGPPGCGDLDHLKSGSAEGSGSRFWHNLGLCCTIFLTPVSLCDGSLSC